MIVGIGLDLCEVERIAALVERWGERFTAKLFTPRERGYATGRARADEHFAARFAAKEAALKALDVPPGLRWHEIEVVNTPRGRPVLELHGGAAAAANARGVARVHLTLSHTASVACAVVVLED